MTIARRLERISVARIFHISLRPAILVKQASIGMFLVSLQPSANSGEHDGEQADKQRENTVSLSAPFEATK